MVISFICAVLPQMTSGRQQSLTPAAVRCNHPEGPGSQVPGALPVHLSFVFWILFWHILVDSGSAGSAITPMTGGEVTHMVVSSPVPTELRTVECFYQVSQRKGVICV